MGANDNKPWACIASPSFGPVAEIFKQLNVQLYLVHFFEDNTSNSPKNWSLPNAEKQWAQMSTLLPVKDASVVPLCSSTSIRTHAWQACKPNQVFFDSPNKHQTPYELWVMIAGGFLASGVSNLNTTTRYELAAAGNIAVATGQSDESLICQRAAQPCLPEALALKWLLINHRDQTLNALEQVGFRWLVARPYVQLLAQDGAVVLEGVAGIGKTYSVSEARSRLNRVAPVQVLADALNTVITSLENKAPESCDVIAQLKDRLPPIDVPTSIFVMHPSTSYEEMIGGLRPAPSAAGGTTFTWQPGKLTRAISAACKDLTPCGACRNHLVVLDEINRCNLPSVLGELIYLIEPNRRVTADILDKAADSPEELAAFREKYSIPLGSDGRNGDLFIPSNLFFLGTMNSSDRSILGFDQALRRRFPPYRLEPMTVEELLAAVDKIAAELKTKVPDDLTNAINAWGFLNVLLRCVIGPDAMIGHSYWFNSLERHEGNPDLAWRFGVLPQAIHAAESARMERFLADLFDETKCKEIEAAYVNPEQDRPGKERLSKAWIACFAGTSKSVTEMVEKIQKMKAVVELIGRGHGEKLVVVDRECARSAGTGGIGSGNAATHPSQGAGESTQVSPTDPSQPKRE